MRHLLLFALLTVIVCSSCSKEELHVLSPEAKLAQQLEGYWEVREWTFDGYSATVVMGIYSASTDFEVTGPESGVAYQSWYFVDGSFSQPVTDFVITGPNRMTFGYTSYVIETITPSRLVLSGYSAGIHERVVFIK